MIVAAAVRVSERRARLLGLDTTTTTRTEMSGSLGVYAERLAAERELWSKLERQPAARVVEAAVARPRS